MSTENRFSEDIVPVKYELTLTAEEASQGATRVLTRNGKRLQVTIPPGVSTGSTVKLTNALQTTDGRSGDILIQIRVNMTGPAADVPAGVVEVTDSSFSTEVLGAALPVVVDFWAPWCGPCRMMSPVIEQAAGIYAGRFKFCKINVDENPATASQYQAMSIPMLLFFNNGRLIDRSVGAIPLTQLKARLDALPG